MQKLAALVCQEVDALRRSLIVYGAIAEQYLSRIQYCRSIDPVDALAARIML
jgi:hypothetical protein